MQRANLGRIRKRNRHHELHQKRRHTYHVFLRSQTRFSIHRRALTFGDIPRRSVPKLLLQQRFRLFSFPRPCQAVTANDRQRRPKCSAFTALARPSRGFSGGTGKLLKARARSAMPMWTYWPIVASRSRDVLLVTSTRHFTGSITFNSKIRLSVWTRSADPACWIPSPGRAAPRHGPTL